jgi:hypothetical protein
MHSTFISIFTALSAAVVLASRKEYIRHRRFTPSILNANKMRIWVKKFTKPQLEACLLSTDPASVFPEI